MRIRLRRTNGKSIAMYRWLAGKGDIEQKVSMYSEEYPSKCTSE